MTADLIGTVSHCGHLDLAAQLTAAGQRVDALIVDAPYSERTHSGHDGGAAGAARMLDYASRRHDRPVAAGRRQRNAIDYTYAAKKALSGETHRRVIDYPAWSSDDVALFVGTWAPLVTGWVVSITDHVLAHVWTSEFEAAGLYSFAPIPLIETGGRVRLQGEGPSSWACWIIVARPKRAEWISQWRSARWAIGESGTLRGVHEGDDSIDDLPPFYRVPSESKDVVGGKPLRAMRSIVNDYSLPGQIVADPCAGGGTTLLAAKLEGRRYIGGDIDAAHVALSRERLRDLPAADRKGTLALFGDRI